MIEHCSDELLSSFLDGDSSPADAGPIAEHVAVCPTCRRSLSELRGIRTACAELEQLEPPARTWAAIQSRIERRGRVLLLPMWIRVGAPALAAAAVLVAMLWGRLPGIAGRPAQDRAASDYDEYVRGIEQAMSECEAAMLENPGNARVRSALLSAQTSHEGAMDRMTSWGD